ncbi:MAG TPA: tripartite tricarboxylate transporter TctB family protein [Acidiferrobacterales bacterium]|nr:tripartite tricarboxylate transporter TctB family protein [Acidiferrobacterales bacterium]
MEQDKSPDNTPTKGLSIGMVDAIAAAVLFIVGAVMMVDNYQRGAGWAIDGPGAGYFPFRVGLIISISAAVIFIQSLFGKERNAAIFVRKEQLKPVLMVLVPTGVYVLAIQLIGIYIASAVFIASFMRIMGKYGWLKIALVSVGVSAIFFWLFEVLFLVPLPKGPLETWFGY